MTDIPTESVPTSGYAACMELRTERLRLRPPDAERDLTDIVAAASDPEMARYLPTMPSPYTVADAERWVGGRVASGWAGGEEKTFVIRNGSDDTFLGVVTVRVREGGSVGYWLARSARGRGVMTEAVRAVVCWVHSSAGIQHLILTTHPDNTASQGVARRTGFVRAGTLIHDPPFRDGRRESLLFEWQATDDGPARVR